MLTTGLLAETDVLLSAAGAAFDWLLPVEFELRG